MCKTGILFAPNRVISKSERPKWRFKVKGFIKQFLACSIENPCYPKAVSALTSLYEFICQSCGIYIFRSEVPFQSLGIDQDDLYAAVVEKIISLGVNEEIMRKLILLAVNVDLSYDCLHEQLIDRLLSILNTEEQRKDLLFIAISMRKEQYQKLKSYKTKYEIPYGERSLLEELNKITFIISAIFGVTQNDVDEYFKYSQDRAEVNLYCMLNYMSIFGVDEDWIDVYRYAITKMKIEPRDYLKNKYQELLKELA